MTCVIKDKMSYTNLFCILESFGECSGLKVKNEKTAIVSLGDNIVQVKHSICDVIKVLGIYFGYDKRQRKLITLTLVKL